MIYDSARAETSAGTAKKVRTYEGTWRSGDEGVPRTSAGSRYWYPVKRISCRPEETNSSERFESSGTGNKSNM